MKKRKHELALVFLLVAVVVLFIRPEPRPEAPVTVENSAAQAGKLDVEVPKMQLSEEARWLITTAADSYTPRVKVEKVLAESEPDLAKKP